MVWVSLKPRSRVNAPQMEVCMRSVVLLKIVLSLSYYWALIEFGCHKDMWRVMLLQEEGYQKIIVSEWTNKEIWLVCTWVRKASGSMSFCDPNDSDYVQIQRVDPHGYFCKYTHSHMYMYVRVYTHKCAKHQVWRVVSIHSFFQKPSKQWCLGRRGRSGNCGPWVKSNLVFDSPTS